MADAAPCIDVRTDGPVGWIVLHNPQRHNAMTLGMWQELPHAVAALAAAPEVRVLAVRGAGEQAFVSGADISEFDRHRDSVEANERYEALGHVALQAVADCPKPTVAMLRGWCIGGGMALALHCDLRIADETLRYGIPAARLGIGYHWTGIKRLVDTVGAAHARHVLLTGRRFDAADAVRMGFAQRVVPAGGLDAAMAEECALLAANAPLTLRSVKQAIDGLQAMGPQVDVARIEAATRAAFGSQDFLEGRRAFAQKRAPQFTGH